MTAIKEVTEELIWKDISQALEENHPKTLDLYTNLVQARTLLDEDLGKGKQKLTNIIKMIGRELGQKI